MILLKLKEEFSLGLPRKYRFLQIIEEYTSMQIPFKTYVKCMYIETGFEDDPHIIYKSATYLSEYYEKANEEPLVNPAQFI